MGIIVFHVFGCTERISRDSLKIFKISALDIFKE